MKAIIFGAEIKVRKKWVWGLRILLPGSVWLEKERRGKKKKSVCFFVFQC